MDSSARSGKQIRPEKASRLPIFHAFTGCDTVSTFCGKWKKPAWQTQNVCEEISTTFTKLSQCMAALDNANLQSLEKFVAGSCITGLVQIQV